MSHLLSEAAMRDEIRRAMVQARSLTDQFYKDLEAIQARRPDYHPGLTEHVMTGLIFYMIKRKLGETAARNRFGTFGPLSKRKAIDRRNYELAVAYGQAGKPNARTGKKSMPAFARLVAQWNKGRPSAKRLGSGTENGENMLRHLKRILKQKRYSRIVDGWYVRRGNGTSHP
jgi:hypothetical protein